jgi:hypothetical protein
LKRLYAVVDSPILGWTIALAATDRSAIVHLPSCASI